MKLIRRLWKVSYEPERLFGDRWSVDHVGQGQDVLLDLRGEAEHAHALGHPGAGDAHSAGDVGLVGDLA